MGAIRCLMVVKLKKYEASYLFNYCQFINIRGL